MTFDPAAIAAPVVVVTGHYGVGKTNLSLNLALDAAAGGRAVTLVDLDIVNPYFRSSDYAALVEAAGVRMIAPVLAGTTLDTPSLSGTVGVAVEEAQRAWEHGDASPLVILDVGGDEVGATSLGRFSAQVAAGPYEMLYVVNRYRSMSCDADETVALLAEIEQKTRLRATGIVANSHLKEETDEQAVLAAVPFAREVAARADLSIVCAAVPNALVCPNFEQLLADAGAGNVYPVNVYVRTPWGT